MGKPRPWLSDYIFPFLFKPAGNYPHNPFCGPRPLKYGNTLLSAHAQFPWVWYWRYSKTMRSFFYAIPFVFYFNYKATQFVMRPENVEEWRIRRQEWYTKKPHPEDAYF